MHTTLAAQLAALELGHLNVARFSRPLHRCLNSDAAEQTLAAVWSDLFALFPDTALEDDAEEIAWAFVNLFHRAAAKQLAQVDGRDFLRARAETRRRAAMPEGSPVLFASGRLSFETDEAAKTLASNVWDTLDKVRDRVADMVLVHGGDSKGIDRLAASWAERRKVPQLAFGLDSRLGQRAGFKRNEQMLSLNPPCLVAFAGNGVLERLVIQAKERGLAVVDHRGPLGTNPKNAARAAAGAA